MNRLFTLFAALLVGVVASAQDIVDALNANKNYVLNSVITDYDDSYCLNEFIYENGKCIASYEYYGYDETTHTNTDGTYKYVFTYDEYGNMTDDSRYKKDNGEWILIHQWITKNKYENGKLVETETDLYDCGEYYDTEIHNLTYDVYGNVIKEEEHSKGQSTIYTSIYEYNDKNQIVYRSSWGDTERYTYDENDRLIRIEYGCVDNGCDVIIEKITYNSDGTEAVGKHYEADGVTLKTNTPDSKYFFTKKTATPSRRTELDHVGAYNFKTVENGQVVIVKDGEKYDLAGRKL